MNEDAESREFPLSLARIDSAYLPKSIIDPSITTPDGGCIII
jgi:hypothetical protein